MKNNNLARVYHGTEGFYQLKPKKRRKKEASIFEQYTLFEIIFNFLMLLLSFGIMFYGYWFILGDIVK